MNLPLLLLSALDRRIDALIKINDCHEPPGSPIGGRFAPRSRCGEGSAPGQSLPNSDKGADKDKGRDKARPRFKDAGAPSAARKQEDLWDKGVPPKNAEYLKPVPKHNPIMPDDGPKTIELKIMADMAAWDHIKNNTPDYFQPDENPPAWASSGENKGTSFRRFYVDKEGRRWLFKAPCFVERLSIEENQKLYGSESVMEQAASYLAQIANPGGNEIPVRRVRMKALNNDGRTSTAMHWGTIQPVLKQGSPSSLKGPGEALRAGFRKREPEDAAQAVSLFNKTEVKALFRGAAFSATIMNTDAHLGNFLRRADGAVTPIDRGQAFTHRLDVPTLRMDMMKRHAVRGLNRFGWRSAVIKGAFVAVASQLRAGNLPPELKREVTGAINNLKRVSKPLLMKMLLPLTEHNSWSSVPLWRNLMYTFAMDGKPNPTVTVPEREVMLSESEVKLRSIAPSEVRKFVDDLKKRIDSGNAFYEMMSVFHQKLTREYIPAKKLKQMFETTRWELDMHKQDDLNVISRPGWERRTVDLPSYNLKYNPDERAEVLGYIKKYDLAPGSMSMNHNDNDPVLETENLMCRIAFGGTPKRWESFYEWALRTVKEGKDIGVPEGKDPDFPRKYVTECLRDDFAMEWEAYWDEEQGIEPPAPNPDLSPKYSKQPHISADEHCNRFAGIDAVRRLVTYLKGGPYPKYAEFGDNQNV